MIYKKKIWEVKETDIDLEDMCIDLKKSKNKFDDEIEIFKQSYNKICSEDEDKKYYYDSWEE
jgi:hypothetical protein